MLNAWGRRGDHRLSSASECKNAEMDICTWRQAYPAYVLNLSCPPSKYDITFKSAKTYVKFEAVFPSTTHIFIGHGELFSLTNP
jgi:hypothetical protein